MMRCSVGSLLSLLGVVAVGCPRDGSAQALPFTCKARTTVRVFARQPEISPEDRLRVEEVLRFRTGTTDPEMALDSLRAAKPKVLEWILADLISNSVVVGNDVAFKAKSAYVRLFGEPGPVLQMSENNNDDNRRGLALDAIDSPLSEEEESLVVGYACDAGAMLIGYQARPNAARPLASAGIAVGILRSADRLLSAPVNRAVVDSISKIAGVQTE